MSILDRILSMPKPVAYHKVRSILEAEGFNPQSIATTISDQCSNTVSGQSVCKEKFYLMDGMLHEENDQFKISKNPSCANKVVTIKKRLNGRFLILLPCTGTAKDGNYFLAKSWHAASLYFPERMSSLDFAATDSISTLTKDGKGLIVFENEMDRVTGYDLFPKYSSAKLEACKQELKTSIPRLLSYERVFSFLNVRLYDEAVQSADLPNLIRIPVGYKQGFFLQGLPELRREFERFI